jgi:lipopolysaccharide heptosyltransferase II
VRDFLAREPGAKLGVVVGAWNRPIAERIPWIDEVHVFDSPRFVRQGRPSPHGTLEGIFARDWDLVIDLTNDPAAAVGALARPSRHRRDAGSTRLASKMRRLASRRDASRDRHAARVAYRVLGIPAPDPIVPVSLAPRPDDVAHASAAIARAWPGERPLAALHAGATWVHRMWPAGRFAELAKRLEAEGFATVLVGGPDDRAVSMEVARAAGLRETRVLAGDLDLAGTAAVFARAGIVVANDGGPMHLAAAMGAPVLGIYGPTDPGLFGPIGATSATIYRKRDCSPCPQRHCIWGRARCLEPIEIEEVAQAALRIARRTAG